MCSKYFNGRFFILHLTNLTLLPIVVDESIYLDWGWSHTHMPGTLYDAQLDAKQPLLIWIFGIFERFFSDPLFAGRLVSVIAGALTMLGIHTITRKLFNKHTAFIAALLYSIVPIFVFYNRQALMEASVACIGIWSFNALLNLIRSPSTRNSIILGIFLGIGFFIKSSSLLFILSFTMIILSYFFKHPRIELLKQYSISIGTFILVNLLVFINPVFWQTFSSNSRYSFTLSELTALPFSAWMSHLLGSFEIGVFFITPFIFVASSIGIIILWKNRMKNNQLFLVFFIVALILEISLTKFQHQRYLVAFLPFLIIPSSYVLGALWNGAFWKKSAVIISFLFPLAFTILIIFAPAQYILTLSKHSSYADTGYIYGPTSGYAITEVMQYIKGHSSSSLPNMVLFALNIGNPESAVDLYSQIDPHLYPLHLDRSFFPDIDEYKCFSSDFILERDAIIARRALEYCKPRAQIEQEIRQRQEGWRTRRKDDPFPVVWLIPPPIHPPAAIKATADWPSDPFATAVKSLNKKVSFNRTLILVRHNRAGI
jgi:uncharacterized membrane protein